MSRVGVWSRFPYPGALEDERFRVRIEEKVDLNTFPPLGVRPAGSAEWIEAMSCVRDRVAVQSKKRGIGQSAASLCAGEE